MGLDITAYSRLSWIGKHEIDPALNEGEPGPHCYYEDHVDAYAYDAFPDSYRGCPVLTTEEHGRSTFLVSGCYEVTPETQTHGFHAGSYGGYGQWRQDLAKNFNPAAITFEKHGPSMSKPDPDLPFYELIWFADNEGCIGPDAARDLHIDFRTHAERYRVLHADDDSSWYVGRYEDWTRAFDLAADGGLVRFH